MNEIDLYEENRLACQYDNDEPDNALSEFVTGCEDDQDDTRAKWAICNLANLRMRYGSFDTEAEAVAQAKNLSKTGEVTLIDRENKLVDFVGFVRL